MEAKLSSTDPARRPVRMSDPFLWDYQYRTGGAEALICVGCVCRSGIIITLLPTCSENTVSHLISSWPWDAGYRSETTFIQEAVTGINQRPLGIRSLQTWNIATHTHVVLLFAKGYRLEGNTLKLPYMPRQTKLTSCTVHWRAVEGWENLRWGWERFCLNSKDGELPQTERKCYTVLQCIAGRVLVSEKLQGWTVWEKVCPSVTASSSWLGNRYHQHAKT